MRAQNTVNKATGQPGPGWRSEPRWGSGAGIMTCGEKELSVWGLGLGGEMAGGQAVARRWKGV